MRIGITWIYENSSPKNPIHGLNLRHSALNFSILFYAICILDEIFKKLRRIEMGEYWLLTISISKSSECFIRQSSTFANFHFCDKVYSSVNVISIKCSPRRISKHIQNFYHKLTNTDIYKYMNICVYLYMNIRIYHKNRLLPLFNANFNHFYHTILYCLNI